MYSDQAPLFIPDAALLCDHCIHLRAMREINSTSKILSVRWGLQQAVPTILTSDTHHFAIFGDNS